MRPVEVTDDEIIEAGKALLAARPGQRITGFGLRQHLGGRGTQKRLYAVWAAHAAQAGAPTAPPPSELPPEVAHTLQTVSADLVAKLASLGAELHRGAVHAAEQRVVQARAEQDQVRQQTDQELADASQTVEELEAQVADLRAALVAERAKVTSATEEAQRQAVELATVRERLTAAELAGQQADEVHAAELAQARVEAAQLRATLDQVREDLTQRLTEQTALVRARDQQLADMREQHQTERAAAAKEAHRQAERFTEVQHERDAARQDAQAARENAAKLLGQLEGERAHSADLGALLRTFRGEPQEAPAGTAQGGAARRKPAAGT